MHVALEMYEASLLEIFIFIIPQMCSIGLKWCSIPASSKKIVDLKRGSECFYNGHLYKDWQVANG